MCLTNREMKSSLLGSHKMTSAPHRRNSADSARLSHSEREAVSAAVPDSGIDSRGLTCTTLTRPGRRALRRRAVSRFTAAVNRSRDSLLSPGLG